VVDSAYAESQLPLDTAIPNGAASLDSIVRTEELLQRPSRPPEPEKENSALGALVIALADSPAPFCKHWPIKSSKSYVLILRD
jgi:hypothetical protein